MYRFVWQAEQFGWLTSVSLFPSGSIEWLIDRPIVRSIDRLIYQSLIRGAWDLHQVVMANQGIFVTFTPPPSIDTVDSLRAWSFRSVETISWNDRFSRFGWVAPEVRLSKRQRRWQRRRWKQRRQQRGWRRRRRQKQNRRSENDPKQSENDLKTIRKRFKNDSKTNQFWFDQFDKMFGLMGILSKACDWPPWFTPSMRKSGISKACLVQ